MHRYIVASSAEALYVAFMGTKVLRDYLTDANYLQAALWPGMQVMVCSLTCAMMLHSSNRPYLSNYGKSQFTSAVADSGHVAR